MKLHFPDAVLRPIGREQMESARQLAGESTRQRAVVRYHDHEEPVQRMVHALEPGSYVRPHRHQDPDKLEIFLALAGRAWLCRWSSDGELEQHVEIAPGGPIYGVEIPARAWHSLLAAAPGTVLYEIIEGAYSPSSHKDYAPWAPPEGTPEGDAFVEALRARLMA